MIRSAYIEGIKAIPVTIEVTLTESGGLVIKGLGEAAARETRVRVKAAAVSKGVALPENAVVSIKGLLHERARSSGFDLPIALALRAEGVRVGLVLSEATIPEVWAFGELSLSGFVRPATGAELVAELAQAEGGIMLGRCNSAFHPSYVLTLGLEDAVGLYANVGQATPEPDTFGDVAVGGSMDDDEERLDGNVWPAFRAAMVAATGGFGLLLEGPMGSGRTMVARRIARILPEPTESERRQLRRIASAAGMPGTSGVRPFRAPHHTASTAAILGGGLPARPGERTLADGGVLFFDELPEFAKPVLAAFHEPAPAGMPSRPEVFVAAMDLCPCGRTGTTRLRDIPCTCKPMLLESWKHRVEAFKKRHIQITVRLEGRSTTPSDGTKCPLTIGQARAVVTHARGVLAANPPPFRETDRILLIARAEVAVREGMHAVLGSNALEDTW